MPINYTSNITPVGMTSAQADVLREDLQEDSLQQMAKIWDLTSINEDIATLAAGNGGFTIKNLKTDYGAVGDYNGSTGTDDTAAIQAAFDDISGPSAKQNIALYIPKGWYQVSSLVTCLENNSKQWVIFGDSPEASKFTYTGTTAAAAIAAATAWVNTTAYVVGNRRKNGGFLYECITSGTSAGSGGPLTYGVDITDGTVHWKYIPVGHMFRFRGVQHTLFRDLCFDGGYLAECTTWLAEKTPDGVTQIASFDIKFRNCKWMRPAPGATADCCRVGKDDGTNALQTSEYAWLGCEFSGNGPTPNRSGIHIMCADNTKNFYIGERSIFYDFDYGFYQAAGSGTTRVENTTFSDIGYNVTGSAVYGGGNGIALVNCGMENGNAGFAARLLTAVGSNVIASVEGGYVGGTTPADDYIIVSSSGTGSTLELRNVSFESNSRVGSNNLKIQANGSGGITVFNCAFPCNVAGTPLTVPPIYDGSNNLVFGDGAPRGLNSTWYATAVGCMKGVAGGTFSKMQDLISQPPMYVRGSVDTGALSTGVTVTFIAEHTYKIVIPYTALTGTAATTKTLNVGYLFYGSKVVTAVADTTVAFIGTSISAVTMSMGVNTIGADAILAANTVHTVNAKGFADADMGTGLTAAGRINGGLMVPDTGPGSALTSVYFAATGANLSALTAGSVTIYITLSSWK